MSASRKFGPETIACLSGRLRIALPAVAVLFLGCGVTSDSSPVAPSAVAADVFTDPPLPGHALVATGASVPAGTMAVVTGEAAAAFTLECADVQFHFIQHIGFLRPGGRAGFVPTLLSASTALIPPGAYPITFVAYCSPYYIVDVDFSHHP